MTLEEAIIHCKEKACDNTQCALEHRQLAEWLQELQQYRKNARKEEYMKAPDKIYIAETPNKLIEIWSEEPTEPKPYITEHEYIRKDALIDKLYKWMDESTTVTDYYSKEVFKKVIDDLF
jgi:hypothetical protein